MEASCILKKPTIEKGEPYKIGEYRDEWGCCFTNIQEGVIGEVKVPLVQDEEWLDVDRIQIPVEWLDFDVDQVNAFCKNTDKFVLGGGCARPFEQLQFIRMTENLFDLMDPPENMIKFMGKMHTFYCDLGIDKLEQYKGKITFWGEIDRQHLLPNGTTQDIEKAVKEVYDKLWCNGGCIAQCEFGPGANPENVYTVFKTWDSLQG